MKYRPLFLHRLKRLGSLLTLLFLWSLGWAQNVPYGTYKQEFIDLILEVKSDSLDEETLVKIGQMAEAMDRPRAWLMAQAIKPLSHY